MRLRGMHRSHGTGAYRCRRCEVDLKAGTQLHTDSRRWPVTSFRRPCSDHVVLVGLWSSSLGQHTGPPPLPATTAQPPWAWPGMTRTRKWWRHMWRSKRAPTWASYKCPSSHITQLFLWSLHICRFNGYKAVYTTTIKLKQNWNKAAKTTLKDFGNDLRL